MLISLATRARVIALAATAVAVVLGAVAVGAAVYVERDLGGRIERVEGVFEGLPDRPARAVSGPAADALNILLLGTDRRSDVATTGLAAAADAWVPGAQRSDTVMLVHVSADRDDVSVVSLPRDSWVEVPGYSVAKLNAAFSLGGPRLAVATVERLTGVRIDHLAIVDWTGFSRITEALGGVVVTVPETVHDSARDITWVAGEHRLDGASALAYVRQRYGLPGGDFDRVRRQQAFLRALLADALDDVRNPASAYGLLRKVADELTVDAGWDTSDLAGLVLSLRDLDPSDIRFLTVPTAGTGMEGDQSVVYVDRVAAKPLWRAFREDDVAAWCDRNPAALLDASGVVR